MRGKLTFTLHMAHIQVALSTRLGLGYYQHVDRMVVVPNTPSMLTRLYTIKHIIEIIPIKFPMGFPDDEVGDNSTYRTNCIHVYDGWSYEMNLNRR